MASINDHRTQLALLRRDPLKHAVILKYLLSTPGAALHQIVRGDRSASLLLLDPRLTSYDRRAYPEATASVLLASDDPVLTRELMDRVPSGERTFFRLPSEADRAVVAERFALERRNAFLSFTGAGSAGREGDAIVGTDTCATPARRWRRASPMSSTRRSGKWAASIACRRIAAAAMPAARCRRR